MGSNSHIQFTTLTEVMEFAARNTSNGMFFIGERDTDHFISYSDLLDKAFIIAAKLQHHGIKKGDELIFQFQENQNFIHTFWACLFAGVIPVPLSLGISEEHKQKLIRLWEKLDNPYLISDRSKTPEEPEIAKKTIQLETLLDGESSEFMPIDVKADDIAFVQFSSGSTGSPKGVTLTHENLLANVNAIHDGIQSPEEGDSFFSWMPLTHDMGLIGFHLTPLFKAWTHYVMPTSMFIRNPISWLRKIEQYRISFTSSPNFGYQYVLKNLERKANESSVFDLSSLRIIVNGAEPISASLCEKFTEKMKDFGLKENVIFPVYGLAEASLAVTFTDWKKQVRSKRIKREFLGIDDTVQFTEENEKGAEFVNVGSSILDCEVRITGSNGDPLGDSTIGKIEIRGLNVTKGYYNDPEVSRRLISEEGWLDTGDLGFIDNGELFVTGRLKDVLFVNGQNFYSHDLERNIEELDGLELGKVVVTGYHDSSLQRDAIAVFVLFKGQLTAFTEVISDIRKTLSKSIGLLPDYILPVRKIPKTTSGKVQRYALCQSLINGEFKAELEQLQKIEEEKAENFFAGWTDTERQIGLIWQQILGHSDFTREDNFFSIGGNSLKAGEVCSMVAEQLQQHLSLADLFKCKNISGISSFVNSNIIGSYEELKSLGEITSSKLSGGQQNIYYFSLSNPTSVAYVIPTVLKLDASVQHDKLEVALQQLVDRHRVLRTRFTEGEEEPIQYIENSLNSRVKYVEIDEKDAHTALRKQLRAFNIQELPLFDCILIDNKADNTKYLMFNIHHIIADGTTVELLINELFDLYEGQSLEEVKFHFTDLIDYKSRTETNGESFLKEYLNGSEVLELPSDHHRPSVFNYEGKKVCWSMPKGTSTELNTFCESHSVTPFQVLLSSYFVFLKAMSGQDDVTVGVPLNSRSTFESRKIAGMFVDNLIFRSRNSEGKTFLDLVKEVQEDFLYLFDNGNYDASSLTRSMGSVRDLSRNPLFDVMFVYQNSIMQGESNKLCEYEVFDPGTAKYDFTLEVVEQKDSFELYVEYNTSLFEPTTIEQFESHFGTIVQNALKNPSLTVSTIGRGSFEESLMVGTDVSMPFNNLCEAIFDAAKRNSKKGAIRSSEGGCSYDELLERSSKLAACLIERGINRGDAVMLVMDRNEDFLVSVLGTLLAGGYFVPVDPELPENRIEFIYTDAEAKLVITDEYRKASLGMSSTCLGEILTEKGEAAFPDVKPSDLAYMIYTSGTTGKPKGVMIEHRAALNYSLWAIRTYFKQAENVVPLYTSISFDLTITSILPPLLSGNTIAIFEEQDQYALFKQVVNDEQINVIKATPSHLKIFRAIERENNQSLDKVFVVGGEDLTTELASEITNEFGPQTEIYNEYGPTEATVGCMIRKYQSATDIQKSVPIGKPIDNTSLLIVDKNGNPVLDGAIGELLIAGTGLARAYKNRVDLTLERFICIPELNNQRFYRSGDLVKKNKQGELTYLGRADEQVKINGYRIELGEIEHCLKDIAELEDAVVCVKENNAEGKIICAYYVEHDNSQLDHNDLKNRLLKDLPAYMVPSSFMAIEEIPLTVNGKVDVNKLPDPVTNRAFDEIREPNELEQEVIRAWKTVFKTDHEISIQDNFFVLGGDSIMAIQVVSALRIQGFDAKVNDVLRYPEVSALAQRLEKTEVTYDQSELSGNIGKTPIVNWFNNLNLENPEHYNQSVLLQLNKELGDQELEQGLTKLINHHDALRINLSSASGEMFFNEAHLSNSFSLDRYELSPGSNVDERLKEIGTTLKSSMNLETELLIKGASIRTEGTHYLLIICHHVVIDGVSWRILLDDLYAVLNNPTVNLPAKTASVKDWSRYLTSDSVVNSAKRNQRNSISEVDFIQKENTAANTREEYNLSFDKKKMTDLMSSAHELYNASAEVVILMTVLRALQQIDGKDRRMVELEHHGRSVDEIDLTRTIGWFTSLYPLEVELTEFPIEEQLLHLKELLNGAEENRLDFGVLQLNENNKTEIYPDVRLNYLGKFGDELNNDLFTFVQKDTGLDVGLENKATAKLEINCMIVEHEFNMQIVTSASNFSKEKIAKLEKCIENQIDEIIGSIVRDDNEGKFTPSDFELSDIEQDDLDQLFME